MMPENSEIMKDFVSKFVSIFKDFTNVQKTETEKVFLSKQAVYES